MRKKVLVLEDDKFWQDIIRRNLDNMNFSVTVCDNSQEAIDIIDKDFVAIVLDVMLESNTSFVLLHEMQSDIEICDIPVIVCSNVADEMQNSDFSEYGVKKILDKSTMNPGDIANAIKEALS